MKTKMIVSRFGFLTHIFSCFLRRRVKKNQFEPRRKVKAFSCVQHDLYDNLKINVK